MNGVHDPVRLKEGEKVQILVCYGPSLPGPGVVADMAFVKPDGTFELRLPPGLHYLELPNSQKPDGTYRLPYCDMGEPCTEEDAAPPQLNNLHRIKIREGQTTEIELSVFRPLPPQKTVDEKKTQIERPNAPQLAEAQKIVAERRDPNLITGTCVDEKKAPVRGARSCFTGPTSMTGCGNSINRRQPTRRGSFKSLPRSRARAPRYGLLVVVRREGLFTRAAAANRNGKPMEFVMLPAATLKGTVRDLKRPAGRRCIGHHPGLGRVCLWNRPKSRIRSRTDAKGHFVLHDLRQI